MTTLRIDGLPDQQEHHLSVPIQGKDAQCSAFHYIPHGLLMIEKPADILIESHPWYPECMHLVKALTQSLKSSVSNTMMLAKPECIKQIYTLDAEITGFGLIALTRDHLTIFRNAYGSYQLEFTFTFLALSRRSNADPFICELPIEALVERPSVRISHRYGKKAQTHFQLLQDLGDYQLWQAQTRYPRLHQIRIHAAESGLAIVGETMYTQCPAIYLSSIKPRFYKEKLEEKPLYANMCLHLEKVVVDPLVAADIPTTYELSKPKSFEVMLKKLVQYA